MKKFFIYSALAGSFYFSESRAQTVNGVRLTELKSTYIEVFEERKLLNTKTFVKLDYGQKFEDLRNSYIKGDDGKDIEFNSGLDCVNKMRNYGYELFQVYLKPSDTTYSKKYYILKKR
ncbi:MAG: hypothetical protein EOO47_12840 [Flavobacterium sp.]|nr:MAG: hypothetical protein EOO47_12840 [Flavobacterium sp.]